LVAENRKKLRRWETRTPRFITCSCYKRLPLLGDSRWRDEFVLTLAAARERLGFKLVAWVAMPEHVHLIIVPTDIAMPKTLTALKQPIAQRAIKRWRALDAKILDSLAVGDGRFRYWQAGGGFDRNLRGLDDLAEKIAYIHRNPVKRGLVERETDWAWSSARWYAGMTEGAIPIDRVSF